MPCLDFAFIFIHSFYMHKSWRHFQTQVLRKVSGEIGFAKTEDGALTVC